MFSVFIDLDDTLLQNNMETFLPAYFDMLTQTIPEIPSTHFLQHLLTATQKMIDNQDPAQTLEQTFDQAFFTAVGFDNKHLKPRFLDFYQNVYPKLQPLTNLRPQAIAMVNQILSRGYQIVIATNPLFPRVATYNRLSWAGLSTHRDSFALVTTYESFHFAKPNLAYYAEILAKLGYPDHPAVMIGNSLQDDIIPAATLGLPCFYLEGESKPVPEKIHPLVTSGNLENIVPWLDMVTNTRSVYSRCPPGGQVAFLKSTAAVVHSLSENLPGRSDNQNKNILNMITGMIEKENNQYIPSILAKSNSSNDPADFSLPNEKSLTTTCDSVQNFCAARKKLIDLVQTVPESDWGDALSATEGSLNGYIDLILMEDRAAIQKIQAVG